MARRPLKELREEVVAKGAPGALRVTASGCEAAGFWTLSIPITPMLLPDHSPRTSPTPPPSGLTPEFPFACGNHHQGSGMSSRPSAQRPAAGDRADHTVPRCSISYRDVIVAIHHDGSPASKVDVLFPPVTHLWEGGSLGLQGGQGGCSQDMKWGEGSLGELT